MGDPSPLSSSDYPKGNTGDPVFELDSGNAGILEIRLDRS